MLPMERGKTGTEPQKRSKKNQDKIPPIILFPLISFPSKSKTNATHDDSAYVLEATLEALFMKNTSKSLLS